MLTPWHIFKSMTSSGETGVATKQDGMCRMQTWVAILFLLLWMLLFFSPSCFYFSDHIKESCDGSSVFILWHIISLCGNTSGLVCDCPTVWRTVSSHLVLCGHVSGWLQCVFTSPACLCLAPAWCRAIATGNRKSLAPLISSSRCGLLPPPPKSRCVKLGGSYV